MTRLPKNAGDAVAELGIRAGAAVLAVAPDHGYGEALVGAVGDDGSVVIVDPAPDEDVPAKAQVAASAPDGPLDVVVAWVAVVGVRGVRDLAGRLKDDGELWAVLPKPERDAPAAVTEGELKKALMPLGWREGRVVGLATDSFAVRFRRRRST